MLEQFRVSNFKSLVNADFRPVGLNLVVGTNNAGKTNLCHALRFLSLTSKMPLDEAAKHCTPEPWNLLNVYTPDDTLEMEANAVLSSEREEFRFTYTLRLACRNGSNAKSLGKAFTVSRESLKVTGGGFHDTILLENEAGNVRLLHEKRFLGPVQTIPERVETIAPTEATMLFRLYDLETNRRANLFKRYLGSWGYYSLDAAQMRSNVATRMDRVLDATGSNLCSVLYTLHNERPREERKLVDAAKLFEPRLDLISFQSPDQDHAYMFFEDKEGHRFGVQNLSDGTLRFLAICFLIISNRRDEASEDPPPLLMIEEPENGIFVGHLKPLFEKLDPSGKQGQFVFTSHNPYFIDLFDGALDGLHVIKSLGNYSAVTKPDPARIQERLGKFSLGEMHFRGLLE